MQRVRRYTFWLALALFCATLLPHTPAPANFTGEDALAGQIQGLTHWVNTALRPQPDLAPHITPHITAKSPFGVNTFLQLEVLPEVRERSLQTLHAAGFRYIRQEFAWEDIEIHAKDNFIDRRNEASIGAVSAWEKYDNIVQLAAQYDIEIIARLGNPPAWSRALGDEAGSNAPPDNFTDYGDYVAAVVGRYTNEITYFQLWNEPNIYPEWGNAAPDPEAFTELLCEGYRRAKEANPNAIILAPALSPTVAIDELHMNDIIFLQRMYNAGAGACFDLFSAQGYGLWSGAKDYRLRPTVMNFGHHLYFRDVMVKNGDAHKPIWISEMAWNSAPEPLPPNYGRVTDEQAAQYAVEAYERARTEWPWVGVTNYWFFKRPSDAEKNATWYYFRLMEPDFTPQPTFDALAAYASDPPPVEPASLWWYRWSRIRPLLAFISGGITFFLLLHRLAAPTAAEQQAKA